MNPLVSVIMPNYNYAKYIGKSIESVLNQSYKNIQLIVIDDCSTDNSVNIIKAYKEKDDRILLLQNTANSGVIFSRNQGIEHAKGEYIMMLDPDDYLQPGKIEIQVKAMLENNSNLSFTDINIIDVDDNSIKTRKHAFPQYNYKALLKRNFVPHSTLMVHRSLLEGIRYDDVKKGKLVTWLMKKFHMNRLIHEDYAFLLKIYRTKNVVTSYIPQPLVSYRVHNNSYSSKYMHKILSLFSVYHYNERYSLITSLFFTGRIALLATVKNAN